MFIRSATGAVGVLAVIAISGCGGSSGLARADLVKKADAICAANTAAGKRIPQPTNIQDATQASAYFNAVEPITARGTTELEALKPDSSVSADWNAYITARKAGLALLQKIQRKANAHDPSGLVDLQSASGIQQQIVAAANKLGAHACAQ